MPFFKYFVSITASGLRSSDYSHQDSHSRRRRSRGSVGSYQTAVTFMILYSEDGSSRYPKSWYQCNRRHVVTYQMNIILNLNLKFIILYDCGLGRVTLKKTYLVSFTISFCALGLKRMNPVDLSLTREANGTSANKFFIAMFTRTRHLFLS